jgi:hypothetical protein
LNFFFDNNLPPQLAHGVAALSKNEPGVDKVIHLGDRFRRSEKDLVWLKSLADDGVPWYVISIDKFKKDHRAEREAIRRAGHTVHVLDPQWSEQDYWSKAARFTLWWPHILKHAALSSGGVYRVPWRHTSQSRFQAM